MTPEQVEEHIFERLAAEPPAPSAETVRALRELLRECRAVLAFEPELREISVLGNTNVNAFKLKVEAAEAALSHTDAPAPREGPKWPALDPESGDFTDGWNQAIDICKNAFEKWSLARATQPSSGERGLRDALQHIKEELERLPDIHSAITEGFRILDEQIGDRLVYVQKEILAALRTEGQREGDK